MKDILSRWLVVAVVAGMVAACGSAPVPDVRDQLGHELAIPGAPNDTGLFLTAENAEISYNGSVLIWDDAVTPAQIERIATSSTEDRRLKSKILRFVADTLIPQQAAVEQASLALDRATAALEADKARAARDDPTKIPVLQKVVEEWFEERLSELVAQDAIEEVDAVRNHFYAYCEAKVWELATSRLATQLYTLRPTPNQMCEVYYRAAGLFQSELCSNPQTGAKSFFQCIWRDGVLKTQMASAEWKALPCDDSPDEHYPTRGEAVLAWLAGGQGKSLIEQLINDTEVSSQVTEQTYSEVFADKVMLGAKLPIKISRREINNERIYADVDRCKPAFSREELRTGQGVPAWTVQDPRILLPIGEGDGTTASDYALIPSTSDSEVNARNWSLLAKYIGLYSSRRVLPDSNQGIAVSVNDYIFVKPKGFDPVPPKAEQCAVIGQTNDADRNNDCAEGDPAFEAVRVYLLNLGDPALRDAEKAKKSALQRAKAKAGLAQSKARSFLSNDLRSQIAKGIAASSDPGAAKTLIGYVLKVTPVEDKMHLALQFADGKAPFMGCFLPASGESCPGTDTEQEGGRLEDVRFDKERAEITFAVPLTHSQFGFNPLERGVLAPYFNAVPASDLAGSLLRFKIYPNRLDAALNFLTGNIWLEREGKTLYSGSTSADAFGQQVPNISE